MSSETQPNYPSQPIGPEDALRLRAETFPDEVYIAVNGLIAERLYGQYAQFTVKALIARMVELGLSEEEIKERNWSRIGGVYKQAGWDVSYSSPGMDDRNYEPYYCFNTRGPRNW